MIPTAQRYPQVAGHDYMTIEIVAIVYTKISLGMTFEQLAMQKRVPLYQLLFHINR